MFFVISHKKAKNKEFDEYFDEEIDNNNYDNEEKIDKSDEELFKRVSKEQFNSLSDDTVIFKTEQITKNENEDVNNKDDIINKKITENNLNKKEQEEKEEIIENYFRSLDNKRKGKHF